MESFTVFDIDKEGFVKQGDKTVLIDKIRLKGGLVTIHSIATADTTPGFNYKSKKTGCRCNKVPDKDMIVLIAKRFYIGPCYECESWNSWPRHNKIFEVSTWGDMNE